MRNPRRALRGDIRLAPTTHRGLGGGFSGARAAADADARDPDRALLRRRLRPACGTGSRAVRRPVTSLCRLCRGAARRRLRVLRRRARRHVILAALVALPVLRHPFTLCTEGVCERVSSSGPVPGSGALGRRRIEARSMVLVGVGDDADGCDDVLCHPRRRGPPSARPDHRRPDGPDVMAWRSGARLPFRSARARLRGIMIEDGAPSREGTGNRHRGYDPSSSILADFGPRRALWLGRSASAWRGSSS